MEAITKFALNSTLGTDEFQPLDKIFNGNWRFVTSSNLFATYLINKKPPENYIYDLGCSLKFNCEGVVRLSCESIIVPRQTIELYLYKNGVIEQTSTATNTNVVDKTEYFNFNVNIEKGAIYSLKAKTLANAGVTFDEVSIYGYPIYANELITRMD